MAMKESRTQREYDKFVEDASGNTAVRAQISSDIELGAVELKNATDDTRAKVKTDGTDNALVITQNTQPLPTGASTSAKQLADDHNVTVTSTPIGLINTDQAKVTPYASDGTEFATKDGIQKVMNCDNIVTARCSSVAASRHLKTTTSVRLVGTAFDNTTKDTNFWTETVTGSGAVSQDGEAVLDTGVTADSTVKYETVQKARFIVGSPLEFRTTCEFYTASTADNKRSVGAYDANNGFFYLLDGETFKIVSRTNTSGSPVDTEVASGSFNGDVSTYVMDTSRHKLLIDISTKSVHFIIDGALIHKLSLTHDNSPRTFTYPITIENNNSGGSTSDIELHIIGATTYRAAKLHTASTYKYISTNTTTICKYGAGELHRIVNVDNAGTVTIYDNTSAAGTQIAVIDTAKALGDLSFHAPFSDGLTIVTAGGAKISVVYE